MLSDWLNPWYFEKDITLKNKKLFHHQGPFPHLEFRNFFKDEKAKLILKALISEQFFLKEADLFKFQQTTDFRASSNQLLQEFRDFLSSKEFISLMENITSTSLKPGVIDMSGTLYQDTDFLLCHDDRLEGRKIAYFYYLSDLDQEDGGQLNLFSSSNSKPIKIEKRIIPQFNTFSFFLVSEKSFHSVEEVISPKQRYAISGWFYGN